MSQAAPMDKTEPDTSTRQRILAATAEVLGQLSPHRWVVLHDLALAHHEHAV